MTRNGRLKIHLLAAITAGAALLGAAPAAHAICDVIPQPEVLFRGETASLNRVFASPGDPLRISIDAAGCEAGSAGFEPGVAGDTVTDFESGTLEGWTEAGTHAAFGVAVGNPGFGLTAADSFICCTTFSGAVAPAGYHGDWAARGVTGLSWDYWTTAPVGTRFTAPKELLKVSGPGGSAEYRASQAEIDSIPAGVWGQYAIAISTAAPTGNWTLVSGSWAALMANVTDLQILGSLGAGAGDGYALDNITLDAVAQGSIATLVFEPPAGPASAVVVPAGAGACSDVTAELAACGVALGGGSVICRDDLAPAVTSSEFAFAFPDEGLAGPVTVAVSALGSALPCSLATTRCADPGAPAGLLACIDEFYAGDGTCEDATQNRHAQFPGLTALPNRNDFEGICDSADPSIPCNNSNADVRFTTDADGNLLIPIDWRGVLVPGTLPIPRLVRASSSVAAFTGAPPEPTQTPGAPIQVPGLGFLQSFSPKGLRVDPLFNPIVSEDAVTDTELFGSADAEFGVVRVLRRSPVARECAAGDRAGLPCIANAECPLSQCTQALCRGGSNDGSACTGDGMCPGGECGAPLFDFSDRYSSGGSGPALLTSAEYTAEAENPAAIDGLVSTDNVFMFVRSESLEQKDLNTDGDMLDDTIVSVRRAGDATPEILGSTLNASAVGPAATRVRQFPFAFPTVSVEDDVVALLLSEPDDGGDNNGDGDDWDAALRVLRLEPGGPVELLASSPASDALARIDRESLTVSDGLVFFRQSELDGAARATGDVPHTPLLTDDVLWHSASPDGRFVAFVSSDSTIVPGDTNAVSDVFVVDRDLDVDGIYDEPGQTSVVRVSVDSAGNEGTCTSFNCTSSSGAFANKNPTLSADGRHVVFHSDMHDLVAGDTNGTFDVFVHDRDTDADGIFDEPGSIATVRLSNAVGGGPSSGGSELPQTSEDGRFVSFEAFADDLVAGDTNAAADVFVHDRDTDLDGIFDEPGQVATIRLTDAAIGVEPDSTSGGASMSPDGRFVAFQSYASNLVAGDTNGNWDIFVVDRDADADGVYDEIGSTTLVRVSVTTAGEETGDSSLRPLISADGRRVVFRTGALASTLAPPGDDVNSIFILHDRDADGNGIFDEPGGIETRRVVRSQETRSGPSAGSVEYYSLTADGRILLVKSLTGSGVLVDRIDLETGIATVVGDSEIEFSLFPVIGPVVTGDGAFLFYRKEALVQGSLAVDGVDTSVAPNDLSGDGDQDDVVLGVLDARLAAPVPITLLGPAERVAVDAGNAAFLRPEAAHGADLNGDLDTDDDVVHLYRNRQGGAAVNLGLAAERLAVSSQVVAALVSEAGEGVLLNGDGDMDDWVVHVNDLATATSGTWTSLFLAADSVQAAGPYVAFTVPEAGQGASLNGDGDTDDRVLRIYDTSTASFVQLKDELGTPITGLAVDDFVLGEQAIAFRVNEFAQGQNLNGVAPPIPGGVADGDLLDSVIHVADLATGTVYNGMQAAIPCPVEACDPRIPYRLQGRKVTHLTLEAEQGGNDLDQSGDSGTGLVLQHFNVEALVAGGSMQDACDLVGGTLGGVCTVSADSCAGDLDCTGGGTCYFPPGGCLLDTGVSCDPETEDNGTDDCTSSQFCPPVFGMPNVGTCHEFQGPCLDDGQCTPPAFCTDDGANAEQLFAAVDDEPDGRQRFVSLGRCSDGDGSCRNDGECNDGATCDGAVTVIATAADPDADGLADPIDNCPDVPNGNQLDLDGDGIGFACDRQSCGDGIQEYTETCDHGASNGLDGVCDASCNYIGAGVACNDGIDNDGDGGVDLFDPGCADAADTSERNALAVCDDGRDNDGDYRVDSGFAGDRGCGSSPGAAREDPQCSNGIDDDGDGQIDFDGVAGFYTPDSNCSGPSGNREKKKKNCGLGIELALLLPLVQAARRRRRAPAA